MSDSPQANVFTAAVDWIAGLLTSGLGLTVAIIAVAWIGYLALYGRIDLRRAASVILGCFVIFGASTIAAGFAEIVSAGDPQDSAAATALAPPLATPTVPAQAQPNDPYAAAALPRR